MCGVASFLPYPLCQNRTTCLTYNSYIRVFPARCLSQFAGRYAEAISTIATVDDDRAKNINKATVENSWNVVPRQNDGLNNSLEDDVATDVTKEKVNNLPQVTTVDDELAKPPIKQSLEEETHRNAPMNSSKVLLDRYERLLKNHLLELGVCRGVYLRAFAQAVKEDTSGEVAEHDEVNAKLKEAMRILELSSRSTRSIVKESTLPEEATARDARVRMWEATLGRKTSSSKLLLLEQELRSLECIVPILRAEQQSCKARLIQPKRNPSALCIPGSRLLYTDRP